MANNNNNNNIERRINSSTESEVRKGPWTMEEDLILINYIANNGEGVWNNLARSAGLNRTGKSCRLRWLNYLRPDVRRGNITPEEQVLIMELHARWGNRWSKIARHLPGRTDNEIKNFWRTRIQKKAKNSETMEFQNAMVADEASTSTSQTNSMEECVAQPINFPNNQGHQVDYPQNQDYQANYSHHHYPQATNLNPPDQGMLPTNQFCNDSNDNFWAVDDFWNIQSLNGD